MNPEDLLLMADRWMAKADQIEAEAELLSGARYDRLMGQVAGFQSAATELRFAAARAQGPILPSRRG